MKSTEKCNWKRCHRDFFGHRSSRTHGRQKVHDNFLLLLCKWSILSEQHYGKLCHLIWGIGEKVLKLWRHESWPFSPGWAANITKIHSWTFRLPWPHLTNWENSLINYLWGRASGPAASAKLRRLFRRLEDWELLRDILLPIMGAPPETPPGPPGLGGLNPSESERFVLDPVNTRLYELGCK